MLLDINLRLQTSSLAIVCGRVGSGKSSLICGLLDELACTSSSECAGGGGGGSNKPFGYALRGSVAYVAQEAFIQNMSIRDNILFGLDYEQQKYERVVAACSLKSDFEMMPGGDSCEIGERGVNLSGGASTAVNFSWVSPFSTLC